MPWSVALVDSGAFSIVVGAIRAMVIRSFLLAQPGAGGSIGDLKVIFSAFTLVSAQNLIYNRLTGLYIPAEHKFSPTHTIHPKHPHHGLTQKNPLALLRPPSV